MCCFLLCSKFLVTYVDPTIDVDGLKNEMRAICQFAADQDFTMKWVDEEGQLLSSIFLASILTVVFYYCR